MNITIIKSEKKDILSICLNEEPIRNIHISIFGKNPKLPKTTTISEWNEQFAFLEYRQAKEYVLRRLAMRSYYSTQLQELLEEKLVDLLIIKRLLKECKDWGFLDDKAWLESFMRSHIKKNSLRSISAKLFSKNIPSQVIKDLLEEWKDPEEEKKKIKYLLKTKYKAKDLSNFKEKQKVVGSLYRKGYSIELIQAEILDLADFYEKDY